MDASSIGLPRMTPGLPSQWRRRSSVQRRRHGNWVLWLIYLLRPTDTDEPTHTHTPQPLQVIVPPLLSVLRSHMLSPPKDAYPFVVTLSVFRRWLLHVEFVISPTTLTKRSQSSTNCSRFPRLRNTSWLMTVSRSPGAKVSFRMT